MTNNVLLEFEVPDPKRADAFADTLERRMTALEEVGAAEANCQPRSGLG